jgi:hypothetical protein
MASAGGGLDLLNYCLHDADGADWNCGQKIVNYLYASFVSINFLQFFCLPLLLFSVEMNAKKEAVIKSVECG